MNAKEELLEHARKIETGELQWVPKTPERDGTCCIGFVCLQGVFVEATHGSSILEAEARFRDCEDFAVFNDTYCECPADAAEFIRAAVANADEA